MQRYANLSGNSSVSCFQIGHNYILVGFTSGNLYAYTYSSTGTADVEAMKAFALAGRGLGRFIVQNVKGKSSKKLSNSLGRVPSSINNGLSFV